MRTDLKVEVLSLGKVLEGEGSITSTLPETEYESFGSTLRDSIGEVEQADCPACIDGRRCLCQADGSEPKIRPRKAGAGISTLAMIGMGDRLAINYLVDNADKAEDLYEFSGKLQENLGNKESGHYDCGAAKGLIKHIRTVSTLDPNGTISKLVKNILVQEAPDENADELVDDVIEQAAPFAEVLEKCGWDGAKYVDSVADKEPSAVERLEVDKNHPAGGHAEDAVVVVDGPVDTDGRPLLTIDEEELCRRTGRRAFVVNLDELRRDANFLGGTSKLSARLLAAGLLHHLGGVYKNLGDGSHPLYIVQIAK